MDFLCRNIISWGVFHELGHNHQRPEWTFEGTLEVTCNLFTLFVMSKINGFDVYGGNASLLQKKQELANFYKHGTHAQWKEDPFLALHMYIQLLEEFGFECFKAIFSEYSKLKQPVTTEQHKRDTWVYVCSRVLKRDLRPFFAQQWKIPVSAACEATNSWPVWFPKAA